MKLPINYQTKAVQMFGNDYVISPHTLLGIWLLIHVELKLSHVGKRMDASPTNCAGPTICWLASRFSA